MNTQNIPETPSTPEKQRKSPANPAIASAILATLAFLSYACSFLYPSTAVSLMAILPVLAVFSAGTFAYTSLVKPSFAALSAVISLGAITALCFLFKIEYVAVAAVLAAPSVLALLSGATVGACTKKKMSMTSAIVAGAAVPAVLLFAVVMIHSYAASGSATETLRVAIDQIRQDTVMLIEEYLTELEKTMQYDVSGISPEGIVTQALNVLPGTMVAFSAVLAFFVHRVMLFTSRLFGLPSDVPEETKTFSISPAAAIIYIVALVLSFVDSSITGTSAHNIAVCLLPGLAYRGACSHFAQRKGGIVKIGCLPIVIFVFLLYMNPAVAVKVLALFGALDVIGRLFPKKQ